VLADLSYYPIPCNGVGQQRFFCLGLMKQCCQYACI
jgi:hypothetical protein